MKHDTPSTHQPRAIDPQRFRSQATGIGHTRTASEVTGAARAARVVDCMPPAQRAVLAPAQGYPRGTGVGAHLG
jgi:hypothetical protein